MDRTTLLRRCRDVLEDVAAELGQPEVAELTSLPLDNKIEELQRDLNEVLNESV